MKSGARGKVHKGIFMKDFFSPVYTADCELMYFNYQIEEQEFSGLWTFTIYEFKGGQNYPRYQVWARHSHSAHSVEREAAA